jgi:hypothetical protein
MTWMLIKKFVKEKEIMKNLWNPIIPNKFLVNISSISLYSNCLLGKEG